jgi:YidC/Oxa1 family membrane protein insertase
LYKKAGVNPMGGCLPMLLQMPILLAMFRFFPASIELRQKSFLWATDLSSFDSILDLPFKIPMYGDHISLFSLLMAASMIFSTKINNSNQPTGQNQATMKMMTWMMPIMMLLVFNNYAAGLSYYYLLANLMTILQTWIIRRFFVDEKAVLAKLNANKVKGAKPKSSWQKRLETAAKQKGYNPPKR